MLYLVGWVEEADNDNHSFCISDVFKRERPTTHTLLLRREPSVLAMGERSRLRRCLRIILHETRDTGSKRVYNRGTAPELYKPLHFSPFQQFLSLLYIQTGYYTYSIVIENVCIMHHPGDRKLCSSEMRHLLALAKQSTKKASLAIRRNSRLPLLYTSSPVGNIYLDRMVWWDKMSMTLLSPLR